MESIEALFNELKELGCMKIAFTGGEPFIRKDAMDIFRLAKRIGFVCEINTNGSLLHRYDYSELAEMFTSINISLHSHIPEIHDKLVGVTGAWTETVSAIKNLKKHNAHVAINSVITKSVADSYNQFKEFVESELRCEWSPDSRIIRTYSGDQTAIEKHQLSTDEIEVRLHNGDFVSVNEMDENWVPTGICKAARNTCFIDADGRVYPCLEFKQDSLTSLGKIQSILDTPFQEIWKTNKFLLMVGSAHAEDFQKCIKCSYYKKCFKCMAHNYYATGNITIPSDEICKTEKFYSLYV